MFNLVSSCYIINKQMREQYLEMRKFGKIGPNVFFWSVKFVLTSKWR